MRSIEANRSIDSELVSSRRGEISPPPAFQFHDGTPEGEAAYFEALAQVYQREKEQEGNNEAASESDFDDFSIDAPLISDDLQTEEWHSYWEQLGNYYETRWEARGFAPWDGQPKEEVVYEDIDWSLYPGKAAPEPTPIYAHKLTTLAADE